MSNVESLDQAKIKEAALEEVKKEKFEAAKLKVKSKMKEVESAKKIVRNLERELQDILEELES